MSQKSEETYSLSTLIASQGRLSIDYILLARVSNGASLRFPAMFAAIEYFPAELVEPYSAPADLQPARSRCSGPAWWNNLSGHRNFSEIPGGREADKIMGLKEKESRLSYPSTRKPEDWRASPFPPHPLWKPFFSHRAMVHLPLPVRLILGFIWILVVHPDCLLAKPGDTTS